MPLSERDKQGVGFRFERWMLEEKDELSSEQQAVVQERFAAEFAALAPAQEPYQGWGQALADICRRAARRNRGEPEPSGTAERNRSSQNGAARPRPLRDAS